MNRVVLVGDSDIAYWPKDLKPSQVGLSNHEPLVSGHPGATLSGVLPHLRRLFKKATTAASLNSESTLFVVACAGENDIGEGISLQKSVRDLSEFVDAVLEPKTCKVALIFLGPKFEPWLEDDPSYKTKYAAMGRAFQKCINDYKENNHPGIHFVDCLTMFCGETANLPGARFDGRAKADPKYFAPDRLHLSREGYAVWKQEVEAIIQRELE